MSSQPTSLLVQRMRLGLTCLSIAANALCAGGIFTFPLISPALSDHLKLTQPQLTTIVLAGMVGQYPFAAIVGKAIDHWGPWACSLASSFFFSVGFGFFALEIAKTPDDITSPSYSSFERLAILYFMAGLGTVTSYFSSLFAASKNFPEYTGMASGTSMALFGLSPLFLSVIASNFFTDASDCLDVTHFVAFMALLAGVVHLFGALTLRTPDLPEKTSPASERVSSSSSLSVNSDVESQDDERELDADERTPLVRDRRKSRTTVEVSIVPVDEPVQTVMDLLKDPYFWILAMIVMFTLGSCEMVISNIGSIVVSLPPTLSTTSAPFSTFYMPSIASTTATQVRLLSISNTLSRLLVGPLADFVSPVASYLPNGTVVFSRKHLISRVSFLTGASFLLVLTYGWMETGIRSHQGIWALSIGTGVAYGSVFTVLPSIMSSIWGLANLGRNFGVVTYAPFIGTPLFSYIYAFVSASHVDGNKTNTGYEGGGAAVCKGIECWQLTFSLTTIAAFLAFCGSIILWRRWKGLV